MKKKRSETQTLHAGCSKAEPKFSPRLRLPSRGAQDGQNLISWRWSLPSPTDPVWWKLMHAISSYRRGNRPTHAQTHTNTATNPQTGPITRHCATKLSTQCNYSSSSSSIGSMQQSYRVAQLKWSHLHFCW